MGRQFQPMLELRLIYRERDKQDLPVYAAIGEVYSPPDVMKNQTNDVHAKWAAVRVKVAEEEIEGSELPGATKLEALEHALYHIKWFLRHYSSPGQLYDLDGRAFDPDETSSIFKSRIEMDRAPKT
jgi:hypothetical protein